DDTLYNETDYLRSAYKEIAQSLQPEDWKRLYARMISLYRCNEDVFGYLSDTLGMVKTDLLKRYRHHDPNISAFDGVADVFKGIKEKDGKIGIITDGRSSTQRKKLEALGLMDLIDKVVISGETGYEKPEEHNFRIVEEFYGDACFYYVADNLRKDFIAPHRLGWKTIGLIDNGLNVHHDGHLYFDGAKMPEFFILSFKEIRIV
ncbi:MAG: HAD family hydrolase, partial [Pricia sp.]